MIVIDAGHGGDDPGAVGNGIIEKSKFRNSNYMANRFRELEKVLSQHELAMKRFHHRKEFKGFYLHLKFSSVIVILIYKC